jgi:hypothetical protein
MSGWPVAVPGGATSIRIANIDDDPQNEVLYAATDSQLFAVGTINAKVLVGTYVTALNSDGTQWNGGWRRYAPGGLLEIALGNLDATAEPELVLASTRPAVGATTDSTFARGEIAVYSLLGTTNAQLAPWGQELGNAQHTGSVDPHRIPNP